jgi:hypothetical protein
VIVVSDRAEVVEAACELDARALACALRSGRYERADERVLAAAIDIISAHGCADELTGDREHGRYGARIGRYVLWSDPQRVAALQTFANQRSASMMLKLGGLYLAGKVRINGRCAGGGRGTLGAAAITAKAVAGVLLRPRLSVRWPHRATDASGARPAVDASKPRRNPRGQASEARLAPSGRKVQRPLRWHASHEGSRLGDT